VIRLLGAIIGAVIAVLVAHQHILDGGERHAVQFALDAAGVGAWSQASEKFFASNAAWKLGLALAVGSAIGAAIQYLVERQVTLGRG
jgi:hypothetical protein